MHTAVNSGRVNTLKLLLNYEGTGPSIKDNYNADREFSESSYNLANLVDKDGWTIAHLAALRHKEVIISHLLYQDGHRTYSTIFDFVSVIFRSCFNYF